MKYLLLSFGILSVCLVLLSIYRNYWVFEARNKVLLSDMANDSNEIMKLVSYYEMYWKVWIWDINKFKKEKL